MIRAARFVAIATCVFALTACSTHVLTAADRVPSLRTTLTALDQALVRGDYVGARRDLLLILHEVRQGRAAHELTAAGASEIVAAARTLLGELTQAGSAKGPTQSPTSQLSQGGQSPMMRPSERATTSANRLPTPTTGPSNSSSTSSNPTPSTPPTTQATPTPSPSLSPTP